MQFAVESALKCLLSTSVKDNALYLHSSLLYQTYEHLGKVKSYHEKQISAQQRQVVVIDNPASDHGPPPVPHKKVLPKPTQTTDRNEADRTSTLNDKEDQVPNTSLEWGKIYELCKSLNGSYEEIKALLEEGLNPILRKDINPADTSDPLLADLKRFRAPSRADHIRYAYASRQVFMDCSLSISQRRSKSRNAYLSNSSVMKHDVELGSKLAQFEEILPGSSVVVIQARDKLKSLLLRSVPLFVQYLRQSRPESEEHRLLTLINTVGQSFASGQEAYKKLNDERRASCRKRKLAGKDYIFEDICTQKSKLPLPPQPRYVNRGLMGLPIIQKIQISNSVSDIDDPALPVVFHQSTERADTECSVLHENQQSDAENQVDQRNLNTRSRNTADLSISLSAIPMQNKVIESAVAEMLSSTESLRTLISDTNSGHSSSVDPEDINKDRNRTNSEDTETISRRSSAINPSCQGLHAPAASECNFVTPDDATVPCTSAIQQSLLSQHQLYLRTHNTGITESQNRAAVSGPLQTMTDQSGETSNLHDHNDFTTHIDHTGAPDDFFDMAQYPSMPDPNDDFFDMTRYPPLPQTNYSFFDMDSYPTFPNVRIDS